MEREELLLVISGLVKMVKSEYPSEYSLTEIVTIWGLDPAIDLTREEVAAITNCDLIDKGD